jgi:DNA-binding transcriptional ArsR family regulator
MNTVEQKVWHEIYRVVAEVSDEPKMKRTIYTNNLFISKVKGGILSMNCESLKNPTLLLLYLLQHKPFDGKWDKHHTWSYWYKKKKLIIASVSIEKMALDLGVSERTTRRWIKQLSRDGLIIILRSGLENLYVLGIVEGRIERYLYCGEAKPEEVKKVIQDKVE